MGTLKYRTLRENVVDAIRMKILKRELEPGIRIIEQELSDELGVSRGPIREALRQLEQEGIVEYTRNIGCSVRKITIEDFYEIYLLRATYEKLAVKLCSGQFDNKDIAKLEEILTLMKNSAKDYQDALSFDYRLHRFIMEKSNSRRLIKVWKEMDYGSVISYYVGNFDSEETVNRQYRIHRGLVDACRTNDVEKICTAISKHYEESVKRFMKAEGIEDGRFKFFY